MSKFFLVVCAGYFIIVALLYLFQRHLIYFPMSGTPTPEESGVPEMGVVALKTDDGLNLKAWYRPPLQPSLPTIVHFHGNAGHIGHRGIIVKPFLDLGFGVLLVTYRGYSGNPGSPSEKGLYLDGKAAIEFLIRDGIPMQKIVLYGDSIGTAVAIELATKYPVCALVLQAPFTSLADVGEFHYPYFPIRLLLKHKFENLKKAGNVQAPVLIIHGLSDDIIPAKFGRRLFDALHEPKKIELIQGVGHNDLYEPGRIIRFIQEQCETNV
jgi:uncharacterized protein